MTETISKTNSVQTLEKQNFTNKTNQQIEVYNNLLAALNTCEQCICRFDNKVANIHLIKAMKAEDNPKKLSFGLEYDKLNNCQSIHICDYQNRAFERTVPYMTMNKGHGQNSKNRLEHTMKNFHTVCGEK
jgi:hypothetical protein